MNFLTINNYTSQELKLFLKKQTMEDKFVEPSIIPKEKSVKKFT